MQKTSSCLANKLRRRCSNESDGACGDSGDVFSATGNIVGNITESSAETKLCAKNHVLGGLYRRMIFTLPAFPP